MFAIQQSYVKKDLRDLGRVLEVLDNCEMFKNPMRTCIDQDILDSSESAQSRVSTPNEKQLADFACAAVEHLALPMLIP